MTSQIVQTYPTKNRLGDRFISNRGGSSEVSNHYDTKAEIFSQSNYVSLSDKLGSHPQQNEENNENLSNQSNSLTSDENSRMYSTLLQN